MTQETLSFRSLFADGTSVGVAIEVPAPWCDWLRALREQVEGSNSEEIIPPHITLVPPVQLPGWDLSGVEKQLGRAARSVAPFRVVLEGAGSFRPTTDVVFAAVRSGAQECATLQEAARQGPLAHELRFDYHPHVTVAHDAPSDALDAAEAALAGFRAEFEVTGFVLYERGPDGVWHTIRTFTLSGRR